MEKSIKTYRDLIVWQKSISLVTQIYKITKSFPNDETYGLSAQMRRCAVSMPSNIAEGYGRRTDREFRQFLMYAHGSTAELQSALYVALDQQYITKDHFDTFYNLSGEISKMILNFSNYLSKPASEK